MYSLYNFDNTPTGFLTNSLMHLKAGFETSFLFCFAMLLLYSYFVFPNKRYKNNAPDLPICMLGNCTGCLIQRVKKVLSSCLGDTASGKKLWCRAPGFTGKWIVLVSIVNSDLNFSVSPKKVFFKEGGVQIRQVFVKDRYKIYSQHPLRPEKVKLKRYSFLLVVWLIALLIKFTDILETIDTLSLKRTLCFQCMNP